MPSDTDGRRFNVFDNYIIEIQHASTGVTVQAGVVVRDGHGFRFFAATPAFDPLEGQLFDSPKAAQRAALRHMTERTQPLPSALRPNPMSTASTVR
jgi:hypothetical protein